MPPSLTDTVPARYAGFILTIDEELGFLIRALDSVLLPYVVYKLTVVFFLTFAPLAPRCRICQTIVLCVVEVFGQILFIVHSSWFICLHGSDQQLTLLLSSDTAYTEQG